MIVKARALMPNDTLVEVTVTATLGELLALKDNLSSGSWSQAGDLLRQAVSDTAANVKVTSTLLVEVQP